MARCAPGTIHQLSVLSPDITPLPTAKTHGIGLSSDGRSGRAEYAVRSHRAKDQGPITSEHCSTHHPPQSLLPLLIHTLQIPAGNGVEAFALSFQCLQVGGVIPEAEGFACQVCGAQCRDFR